MITKNFSSSMNGRYKVCFQTRELFIYSITKINVILPKEKKKKKSTTTLRNFNNYSNSINAATKFETNFLDNFIMILTLQYMYIHYYYYHCISGNVSHYSYNPEPVWMFDNGVIHHSMELE